MPRYSSIGDDVDVTTKWWSDYPTQKYTNLAKAQSCFDSLIGNIWSKPKRLCRSASYTNLTYIKEAQHDYPIKRSPSVSSLAPSLALPIHHRQAERIVHTAPVYKPFIYDWYNNAYSTSRFVDTQRELLRPGPKLHETRPYRCYEPTPRASHVPYYTFQTKRLFFEERAQPYKSYLRGSQNYLDKYVSQRTKSDDFANRFVHSAYEWHKPHDHAFNRHFMYGEKVYVPHAPSTPHSYNNAQPLRKIYKTTGRFRFA
ncbi:29kDa protein from Anisakis simplex [Ditylenchus destructor]|nr:29kDa protein from Anisakis simplex [Ditylenchus destructor]